MGGYSEQGHRGDPRPKRWPAAFYEFLSLEAVSGPVGLVFWFLSSQPARQLSTSRLDLAFGSGHQRALRQTDHLDKFSLLREQLCRRRMHGNRARERVLSNRPSSQMSLSNYHRDSIDCDCDSWAWLKWPSISGLGITSCFPVLCCPVPVLAKIPRPCLCCFRPVGACRRQCRLPVSHPSSELDTRMGPTRYLGYGAVLRSARMHHSTAIRRTALAAVTCVEAKIKQKKKKKLNEL